MGNALELGEGVRIVGELSGVEWVSDIKAALRLIKRFERIQSEFGWGVRYDTFRKLYSAIPDQQVNTVFKYFDSELKGKIDVLQIFAATVLVCNASFADKVYALFDLFDMDLNNAISRDEMTIMIRCSLLGFCRFTGQPLPKPQLLSEVASLAFRSVDRQNKKDNRIEKQELLAWSAATPECVHLLCKFNTSDAQNIRKNLDKLLKQEMVYYTEKPPIPTLHELKEREQSQARQGHNT